MVTAFATEDAMCARLYTPRMHLNALVATLVFALSFAPTPEVLRVREWRAKNEKQILAELFQLIALPNLASNRADIRKNAELLTSMFEKRRFAVTLFETKGNPVVYARKTAAAAKGTLTF